MDENNIKEIVLKRALRIKGEVWPAKRYKVPEEMTGDLADWIARKIPDAIESVGEPEIVEIEEPTLAEYLPEKLAKPTVPPKAVTAYDKLMQILETPHLVEIYGSFGSGKTNLVYHIALEAQRAGKQVFYFDTEAGLPESYADKLSYYEFVDDLMILADRIKELAETGPKENGLIVADSIGYPLYARYKELIDKEPGKRFTAWQDLLPATRWAVRFARGIPGEKKGEWVRECRNLSIMTNQPVSEIRREYQDEILAPFGGKLTFLPKLVMHSEPTERTGEFRLVSYKSIKFRRGQELARFTVTDRGVSINWLV